MMNLDQRLDKYAELAVKVGVNIQKDQILYISSSLEVAPFTRKVVRKAYEAGARHVYVDWADEEVMRAKFELAPEDAFSEVPEWLVAQREYLIEKGGAIISIVSQSPDALKGIEAKRIADYQKATGTALNKFRQAMQADKFSWSVIAAAGQKWAEKVFPDADNSVDLLWDAILKAVRVDSEDPIQTWKEHDHTLRAKADYLNEKKYKALHYRAPGTDLTIRLSDKHEWCGAGSINANGHSFMANMPTEEVFTVPLKEGVNGTVTSTKPLSYGGNVIDRFSLTFENGKAVSAKAEVGEDVLLGLLDTDEGSRYLGEVALVPHRSPISDTNVLFYNTLFDENASNHLAIGSGYAFCLKGGKEMSQEELIENGVNNSITHVDFMIGSAEMDIDGELADGTLEPIFRGGNWAF